jgi:Transposase DDE domain/Transposase domain (DUF772)
VTSSRRIEGLCRTDVAFKVICGGGPAPDHVTIARFRAGLGGAGAGLFDQVLALCARLGMGELGLVTLDGMKIAASASAQANRTEGKLRELAEQIAAEHAATDAAEDKLFGPGRRGDELPAELADPRTRAGRIAAALAELEAERQAGRAARQQQASDYLAATAAAGKRPPGNTPASAVVSAAQLRLDQAIAAQQAKAEDFARRNAAKIAATGTALRERPPAPGGGKQVKQAAAGLERARERAAAAKRKAAEKEQNRRGPGPVRNTTDPHSRLMPTRRGFIQGYNTQNVTTADGLIIATALTRDTTDTRWFGPMLTAAQRAAATITASRPAGPAGPGAGQIGLILADAGYLSEHNLTLDGPDRLIATGKNHTLAATGHPRRGGGTARGPAALAMAARLATPDAITAYRHRGHIAETPHGHIKHNLGIRQLSVRGLPRAAAEWNLICTVHNLFKAITAGHLTTTTLTS